MSRVGRKAGELSGKGKGRPAECGSGLYYSWYASSQIWARLQLAGWGRFVATHQVAVLLLCCVFLCTLTYPVLSLYAWAAPSSTSDFFDFLRTSPTWSLVGVDGSIARTRDLKLPWQDLDALVVNAEEACWQRIPKFREISVHQILLGFPSDGAVASEHGVLDRRALHSVYKLERKLQDALLSAGPESFNCAKLDEPQANGHPQRCFTLSPMAYWNNSENAMLSDISLIATVNLAQKKYHDFPLRQDILFGGRYHAGTTFRKADYAVITVFLEGRPESKQFNSMVTSLATGLDIVLVDVSISESRAVMKHRSDVRVRSRTTEDIFFYAGYCIVVLYIYMTLRGLDKVHSKSGLVFTGIVQMLISGMMSLSLCALAGYKIDLVPWKLIPFLIVVLGVDNMFVLTTAVSSTSIDMPVKERIAEGLAQSGVSIFLNLNAELIFLWLLYIGIPARVIREMIVFNAVALIVDFGLSMTYFTTVLSVDMQRLELADFIVQGSRSPIKASSKLDARLNRVPPLAGSMIRSFQERKARTYTAILLVASNWFLYILFGADYFVPAFCSNLDFAEGPKMTRIPGTAVPPSEAFWQLLGARFSEAVHVHIASPSVFFFGASSAAKSSVTNMTWSSIVAVFKYVGIPISLTTLALYIFLRFLLKGRELLTNSAGSNGHAYDSEDQVTLALEPVEPLKALCVTPYRASDVEALAISTNGRVAASWVPCERKILVSFRDSITDSTLTTHPSLKSVLQAGETITELAVMDSPDYCAAITSRSRLLVWPVVEKATPLNFVATPDDARSAMVSVFAQSNHEDGSPPRASSAQNSPSRASPAFCTLHEDGSVVRWDCAQKGSRTILPGSRTPTKLAHLRGKSSCRNLVIRILPPASEIEVWHCLGVDSSLLARVTLPAGSGSVSAQAICALGSHPVLAVGTSTGHIICWDVQDGRCVYQSQLFDNTIRSLRLRYLAAIRCPMCGATARDSVLIAAATSSALHAMRLSPGRLDSCTCRSFSPAATPSATNGTSFSPTMSRLQPSPRRGLDERQTMQQTTLSYPLSPHAMRRPSQASERRKLEDAHLRLEASASFGNENSIPESAEMVFDHSRDTSDARTDGSAADAPLQWHSHSLGTLTLDERGTWELCGATLVGVRRRMTSRGGSPLARWEAWTCRLDRHLSSHGSEVLPRHAVALNALLATTGGQADGLERGTGIEASAGARDTPQLPFNRIRLIKASEEDVTVALGNLLATLSVEESAHYAMTRTTSRAFA